MSDLSADAIAAALTTRRLGRPVIYYASIESTNDEAKARAAAGAAEGLLVVADEQTAGRGRGARVWWAPPGSALLMSLLLRPALPADQAPQATMCLGLGAVEGIAAVTGLRVGLKWPNDLVLDGRKLAGMLNEMEARAGGVAWVVLGLGLNVNAGWAAPSAEGLPAGASTAAPPPADVTATAVWLSQALGRPVERSGLLAGILAATERRYEQLLAGRTLHEDWAARLDTLGRNVTVTLPNGRLQGLAAGVNPQGALLVQTPDGQVHTVWAGDVTTLRVRDEDNR